MIPRSGNTFLSCSSQQFLQPRSPTFEGRRVISKRPPQLASSVFYGTTHKQGGHQVCHTRRRTTATGQRQKQLLAQTLIM